MIRLKKISKRIVAFAAILAFVCIQTGLAFPSNANLSNEINNDIMNRYAPMNLKVTDQGNGHITLDGSVNSVFDKYRIYSIVARIHGVKSITNDLSVDTKSLPDKMVQQNVRYELNLMGGILDPSRIKVAVDNGLVELSGKVSFYREKLLAVTAASVQKGVKAIADNIKVDPYKKAVSDKNLDTVLRSVRHNEFPLSNNVKIKVKNRIVYISGSVHTLWTKKNMKDEFSSIMGIKKVISNEKVKPA